MIPHPETRFAPFAPQGAKKHLGRPDVFLETTQTVITIDDVRAVGLCVNGTRVWFARHDLDFRAFLREGCDAETLLATGDAMAQRVVEHARNRPSQREQG